MTEHPEKLKPPLRLLCWKGLVCLSAHNLVSIASQPYDSQGFYDARPQAGVAVFRSELPQVLCCGIFAVPFHSQEAHHLLWRGKLELYSLISAYQSVTLHLTMRWSHYNTGKATLHIRRNSLQGSICFWALCLLDRLCFSRFGHFSILLRSPTRNMWSFLFPILGNVFCIAFL